MLIGSIGRGAGSICGSDRKMLRDGQVGHGGSSLVDRHDGWGGGMLTGVFRTVLVFAMSAHGAGRGQRG